MSFSKAEKNTQETTNQNQTAQGTQTKDPWAQQVPYLTDAFQQAQSLYNNPTSSTPISQQQAQLTPEQLATFQGMYGYANSNKTPGQTAATGSALTGQAQQYLAANAGMSPENVAWMNSRVANQYANGQDISGQTTAAMRDATRAVNEQALPAVARDSAASGNTFSNRRALQEGVIQRGLAEKTADTSANLRANAYNTGLGLAQNERSSALSNAMQQAGLGLNASNSALGQQAGLYQMANAGAAGGQAANQIGLDNTYSQASAAQQTPWQNLMNYLQVVGGQQWGGTTSSNTATQSSGYSNKSEKTPYSPTDIFSMGSKLAGMF